MIPVEINQDTITPALRRLQALLTDMSPVMLDISEYLLVSTKERFAEGRSPQGVAWAPKSASTLAAYRARGDRADPRPLFGPSGALNTTISRAAGPDWAEVGSNMIYAAVMHYGAPEGAFGSTARGSPIPWGSIPARPFIGLSQADEANILEIVGDWMARVAGDKGG